MQPVPAAKSRAPRAEQIILCRVSGQLFAISSGSVQEVRSVDGLTGTTQEIPHGAVPKVRHTIRRGDTTHYVVSGTSHFGLPPASAGLVFFLRHTPTALLIDGIDKMTSMTYLQALPQTLCHEEREWYRGLTALDQTIVPVVKPEGFLTVEELTLLDSVLRAERQQQSAEAEPRE